MIDTKEPKIKNKQQAQKKVYNALLDLDYNLEKPKPVNKGRDFIIMTKSHKVFYCKYQSDWKLKDEFNKGTIYGTINKGLFNRFHFDYLVICHGSGKIYYTTPQKIRASIDEGLTRKTVSQKETVINIPIERFDRLEEIENE